MKKWLIAFLIIILIVSACTIYIYTRDTQMHTIAATVSTYEEKYSQTGYVVKNEIPISFYGDGILKEYVTNGQRVAKGSLIASVYETAQDGALISQIAQLDEQIAALSEDYGQLSSNDILKIETLLSQSVVDLGKSGAKGDIKSANAVINNIDTLLSIRHSGNKNAQTTVDELKAQRAELEGKLSHNKRDIYAPQSGIFVSSLDGYEGIVTSENMLLYTPGELDSLLKQSPDANTDTACKVIDNYKWHMLFNIDKKYLEKKTVGQKVVLVKKDTGEKLNGTITSISEPDGDMCTVCVASDSYFEGFYKERIFDIELVFSSYTGYVIPARAVHVLDSKYGVYIKKANRPVFREIDIIYQSDEFVVAKNDNAQNNGLLLYDNIIVDGDISEFYN